MGLNFLRKIYYIIVIHNNRIQCYVQPLRGCLMGDTNPLFYRYGTPTGFVRKETPI